VKAHPGAPWGRVILTPMGGSSSTHSLQFNHGALGGARGSVVFNHTCPERPRSACSPTLSRIVYSAPSETTIVTAPVGTAFHGVSLLPCVAGGGGPSGAPSPTLTRGV